MRIFWRICFFFITYDNRQVHRVCVIAQLHAYMRIYFYDVFCVKVCMCHYSDVIISTSNHQSYDCLHNRLFRRRSKKTSKLRVTGLCAGNSPVAGECPHKGPVTRKMFPFNDIILIYFARRRLAVFYLLIMGQ